MRRSDSTFEFPRIKPTTLVVETPAQRELTYSAYLIVAGPDSRKLERRIPSAQRDFTYSAHLVAPGHLYPLQLLLVLIV